MSEKLDRETKKEIAKIGMTATLGITVITAPFLKRNRLMKNLHTGAGVALVAFSLWHQFLYQPEKRTTKVKSQASNTALSPAPAAASDSAADLPPSA
ncbi:hypothetical protein JWJ90_00910 [Desulfobulbus rhabdoformis]|jgi:hypothetical protein|uniref:hypothetical protein n=1 Tax=Desulfobulbus rhabdoformis TaxID=34032 RepID=UPI0019647A32|nr:hypothetical protein [Desulfobulbus rhabdoformis]MBM9612840.1 hypothetical protein [Desulfobulbus rhabdoformis]